MAQPACSPKLRLTRQSEPRRYCRPGCLRYCAMSGERCREPRMREKARMDSPAKRLLLSFSLSSTRQMTRNMSPLFLFGAPLHSLMTPWTISAIWFTKVMIFAWSTSVATLKSRTRATPMTHSTRVPGIMAFTPAESPPFMLCPMMLAPASPKPSTSKEPSLMMVFSRMTVSIGALLPEHVSQVTRSLSSRRRRSLLALASLALACSSALNSASAIFMATSGLSRIASTRFIMLSTGLRRREFASLENESEAARSRIRITSVLSKLKVESMRV
mmetsp:Transcript_29289/g.86954  ORF Transcript_29289/g.86954 Transcript_29289/m.86954 type:complete len:273 (+) Transcript_29289:789-1607(+)